MQITPDELSALIAAIYSVVRNPEGFPAVLRRIRELTNGASAMLVTPLRDVSDGGFCFEDHFDTELVQRSSEYYRALDAWARERATENLVRTGVTVMGAMLIPDRERCNGAFDHEATVAPDVVVHVCCSAIIGDDDPSFPLTYLSVCRGAGCDPFGEDERRAMRLLAPHVLQALRLAYRLRFAESARVSTSDALHALKCGVVLIDIKKKVIFMNGSAERLCSFEQGLSAIQCSPGESMLQASVGREDFALQNAIDSAMQCAGTDLPALSPASGCPVKLHGPPGSRPLVATALPLSRRASQPGSLKARVVILLEDPAQRVASESLSCALFGLTPAEYRVVEALLAGERPKAIAYRLGVSESTVRSHIKALYRKTDAHGIAALSALLSPWLHSAGVRSEALSIARVRVRNSSAEASA